MRAPEAFSRRRTGKIAAQTPFLINRRTPRHERRTLSTESIDFTYARQVFPTFPLCFCAEKLPIRGNFHPGFWAFGCLLLNIQCLECCLLCHTHSSNSIVEFAALCALLQKIWSLWFSRRFPLAARVHLDTDLLRTDKERPHTQGERRHWVQTTWLKRLIACCSRYR